jgi:hypothetical protein
MFLNGKIVGGWRRVLEKDSLVVRTRLLASLNRAETKALRAEVERYARFLGLPLRSMIPLR